MVLDDADYLLVVHGLKKLEITDLAESSTSFYVLLSSVLLLPSTFNRDLILYFVGSSKKMRSGKGSESSYGNVP